MKYLFCGFFIMCSLMSAAQELRVKARSANAISGSAFAKSISDSLMSPDEREERIFTEIRSGNIPHFYRKLVAISDTGTINGKIRTVRYYVIPDFLAIGSDDNYFYCPMRPALAQRLADLLKCSLPTRKISDQIYKHAALKMIPAPVPPTKAMTTVPVFIRHSQLVNSERNKSLAQYPPGSLVSGNKKDIVVSNKIYSNDGKSHVVIYGWHKPDGKAIQPLYNGHDANWADYSHGVRLVQNRIWVDGKRTSISKVLRSGEMHILLSDEGAIGKPYYPY